jgi:hypothetical protein
VHVALRQLCADFLCLGVSSMCNASRAEGRHGGENRRRDKSNSIIRTTGRLKPSLKEEPPLRALLTG